MLISRADLVDLAFLTIRSLLFRSLAPFVSPAGNLQVFRILVILDRALVKWIPIDCTFTTTFGSQVTSNEPGS